MNPSLIYERTKRYTVLSIDSYRNNPNHSHYVHYEVHLDWNCDYTARILRHACLRRPWCSISEGPSNERNRTVADSKSYQMQIADFENIDWDSVSKGESIASSYIVRKGLSRKAQMALQLRRYVVKHPDSILGIAVPETIIIETWNAFEDMKLDMGGGLLASFDLPGMKRSPLRQRLDWILSDVRDKYEQGRESNPLWILKPSVANKGADISLIHDWDSLLDALEATPDMREWVLQKYVCNPLLINRGHKFHLRVYVLCTGALNVFVYDKILMLLAARRSVSAMNFD